MCLLQDGIRNKSDFFFFFSSGKGKLKQESDDSIFTVFHSIYCLFVITPLSTSTLHLVYTYSNRLMTNSLILITETKSKRTSLRSWRHLWSLMGWHKQKRPRSHYLKAVGTRGYSRHFLFILDMKFVSYSSHLFWLGWCLL